MKYCPKCGNEMADEDLFCSKCGQSFNAFIEKKQTNIEPRQSVMWIVSLAFGAASILVAMVNLFLLTEEGIYIPFITHPLMAACCVPAVLFGILCKRRTPHSKWRASIIVSAVGVGMSLFSMFMTLASF